MPEAETHQDDKVTVPPVDKMIRSTKQAPVVWPSASTSGGGAYIPSPGSNGSIESESESE
jgi:hypothetical protein